MQESQQWHRHSMAHFSPQLARLSPKAGSAVLVLEVITKTEVEALYVATG